MENILEVNNDLQKYKKMVSEACPAISAARNIYTEEVYKDAALSAKMKRLIGVAISVKSGSFSPLVNQTRRAVDLGATKEEVMEAVAVAIAMGGISIVEHGANVVKVLEELGKW